MEFDRVLRRRRMTRLHSGERVPSATLDRVAGALARGPSAGWAQGVTGILVTDETLIGAIARACGEDEHADRGLDRWLSSAAAHLVVCVEPGRYRARYAEPDKDPSVLAIPWWWVDGGAALMAVLLAAVDAGIAAGFLGGHRTEAVRDLLGVPDDVHILGLVTLGPPAGRDRPSSSLRRKRRSDVIRREHW
jgi:FMN reductase [NAD(P)H]